MMKNRVGKFRISRRLYEAEPRLMQMVLATTVVLRCDFDYGSLWFEYTAASEAFDEVAEVIGEIAHYGLEWEVDGLTTGFSWKRGGGLIDMPRGVLTGAELNAEFKHLSEEPVG